jgi:hypothetical protein
VYFIFVAGDSDASTHAAMGRLDCVEIPRLSLSRCSVVAGNPRQIVSRQQGSD